MIKQTNRVIILIAQAILAQERKKYFHQAFSSPIFTFTDETGFRFTSPSWWEIVSVTTGQGSSGTRYIWTRDTWGRRVITQISGVTLGIEEGRIGDIDLRRNEARARREATSMNQGFWLSTSPLEACFERVFAQRNPLGVSGRLGLLWSRVSRAMSIWH